ncbi:MAG: GDP-mannose 4,6-dehydratase, partial [Xenococcus sp. (in: cyanobacteria)]
CRIAQGSKEKLNLGNISVKRDWGWAAEYVEAMYLMLQQDIADDYVIATGQSYSLEELVAQAFNSVGLNWGDYVITDPSLLRPTDLAVSKGNPSKAQAKFGWKAKYKMPDVIKMMVEAY